MPEAAPLAISIMAIALVYASVGQAGASGYLAALALFGFAPAEMKTAALSLNLLVAGIGTIQFWRAGLFSWRTFYPFAVLGFPFSLIGGAVQLPPRLYYEAVGVILILSAAQMIRLSRLPQERHSVPPANPPFIPALLVGAVIGFISGTTGTGGGVFLAPIIYAMQWVSGRRTAAVTAAYNLLNSAAALAGAHGILNSTPAALPIWLAAAGTGGAIGAFVGSRYLPERAMRLILAAILFASGTKLLFA
jgi:uncharacterized membrane protein YfcA